jgi:hypothetical protein
MNYNLRWAIAWPRCDLVSASDWRIGRIIHGSSERCRFLVEWLLAFPWFLTLLVPFVQIFHPLIGGV